jgi:hypothetical protein
MRSTKNELPNFIWIFDGLIPHSAKRPMATSRWGNQQAENILAIKSMHTYDRMNKAIAKTREGKEMLLYLHSHILLPVTLTSCKQGKLRKWRRRRR